MILVAIFEPMVPALLTPLIDENLINKNDQNSWKIPTLLLLVFIFKGIAEYLANVSSQWIANKAISEIRQDVFEHQISLPLKIHQKETLGRITSRFLYDIPQVSASISSAWIIIIRDSMVLVALTGYLFYVSWHLTIIMLLVAPPIAYLIDRVGKKMRKSNLEIQETTGELAKAIDQSVNGIKEIKLYGNEIEQNSYFRKLSENIRKKTMKIVKLSAANVPIVQFLAALAVTFVIYIATLLSDHNELSPGEFVSFIAAMSLLFEPIRRLTSVNNIIQKGLAASRSIFSLLNLRKERIDKDGISKGDNWNALIPKNLTSPLISFEDVSFIYSDQTEFALNNISFDIFKNESIGIVGASGSGKTTIVNLLLGFYYPTRGNIKINSRNIEEIPLHILRRNFSWVGQPIVLFNETIRFNLLIGKSNANDDEINNALHISNSYEFVNKLEDKLDFIIGTNGSFLSSGQCQRLAIGRAMLRNAPIFLFDEATSALDSVSEEAIRNSISKIKKLSTVITIAHKISTIKDCDRILVLDSGSLYQIGSHEELVNKEGVYKKLFNTKESKKNT